MIKPEIINYIEENIDKQPQEMIADIKEKFAVDCRDGNVECLCQAIEQTIMLYKEHGQEKVTEDMHQRLMSNIKKTCE